MTRDELIAALRRLKVETGSLACLGCGREHNCSTQGCAILREAVKELAIPRRSKPSKTFIEHIKILRGLRRTALHMADADPDAPTSWNLYADALLDKLKIRDLPIRLTFEILETPTIDAVPVVRCRECAVPHNEKTGCPRLLGVVTMPDFFCRFGVRGEEHDK